MNVKFFHNFSFFRNLLTKNLRASRHFWNFVGKFVNLYWNFRRVVPILELEISRENFYWTFYSLSYVHLLSIPLDFFRHVYNNRLSNIDVIRNGGFPSLQVMYVVKLLWAEVLLLLLQVSSIYVLFCFVV